MPRVRPVQTTSLATPAIVRSQSRMTFGQQSASSAVAVVSLNCLSKAVWVECFARASFCVSWPASWLEESLNHENYNLVKHLFFLETWTVNFRLVLFIQPAWGGCNPRLFSEFLYHPTPGLDLAVVTRVRWWGCGDWLSRGKHSFREA